MAFLLLLKITIPNSFREEAWTVGKEISLWVTILLLIGIANFFLRELIYDNPNNFSFRYLVTEVVNTFIIGSFFAVIAVMANYIYLLRSNAKNSLKWNELIDTPSHANKSKSRITITAQNEKDKLVFRNADFLFAKSDGNYVEFFIKKENGGISREITRNTLTNVEEQFLNYKYILKVHRSYIVNLQHVQSVSGNAQGYKLTLSNTNIPVPVSRTYIPVLDAALQE